MKTERLTLLVTPGEKAAINARAEELGVSASEYVRKAALLLDAEDMRAIDEMQDMLPDIEAAIGNMEASLARTAERSAEHEKIMAYQRSETYREKVRQEVRNDPNIDWNAVARLFGRSREDIEAAE